MPNRFADKDIRVIVVGTSSSIRQVITSVLKELGFKKITGVGDIKSSIEVLESEIVDWVICPVTDNNDGNALHLLTILNEHPEIRHTKVSMYTDNKSHPIIPKAYESGLFSHHSAELTIADVKTELGGLMSNLEKMDGDFCLVAASYLREHLDTIQAYEEVVAFEKEFLELYPGNLEALLSLAKASFHSEDFDGGRVALHQVQMLDPDNEIATGLCQKFLGQPDLNKEDISFVSKNLGFNTAVVIDSNQKSLSIVYDLLKKAGFANVATFENPVKALAWLRKNRNPDIILSEWQLPILPGPVFLYKLRKRVAIRAPLLLMNEAITDREIPMVRELGAAHIVSKPIDIVELQKCLMNTIKQSIHPSDPVIILEQLKHALQENDHHKVRSLKKIAAESNVLTDSQKSLIEAQIAFDSGCYIHAKKHALNAIHFGGDSTSAMNILGQSAIKLREFDLALRCLGNSQFLCPLNVDHLCDIAECHLEKGDDSKYNATIAQAKAIDDNERVREVEAKAALQKGHLKTARKLLERLQSFKEVLAYTNNRAVTFIRNGDFEEGLELYKQALQALPETKRELHALIRYNIGLAYARQNDLDAALAELKKGENCKNPSRRRKIKTLKKKIIDSIEKGSPLVLNTNAPPTEEDEEEKLKMFSKLDKDLGRKRQVSRSDYCCYKIYTTALGTEEANDYMRKRPSFAFRGKIIKDFRGIRQDSA